MFSLEQIKKAHSKVKSGLGFPQYVQDLIKLGVTHYDTYVTNGHTDYYGLNGFKVSSEAMYANLIIAENPNSNQFTKDLKAHQQGKTDYLTFCNSCAESGINKWTVGMGTMTCTYYDQADNVILTEGIPN